MLGIADVCALEAEHRARAERLRNVRDLRSLGLANANASMHACIVELR